MWRGVAFLIALALPALEACGARCSDFCSPHDLTVTASGSAGIVGLVAGDSACSGAAVACTTSDDAGACRVFDIQPAREGNCHLDVQLDDGSHFTTDITVVRKTGCCPGLFADPPTAANIIVP